MYIRRAVAADRDILLDCWLRSVRATHDFVAPEDIDAMIPQVSAYLTSNPDIWGAADGDVLMGFMGMSANKMDALFLAPEFHGRGVGRQLVEHARSLHGELLVDVNEQNHAARGFYESCGFVVESRSELDDDGRPYPILHMRLAAR